MVTVATSLPVENGREAGRLPRSSSAPLLLVGLSVFGGFQNSWGVQFLHDKKNTNKYGHALCRPLLVQQVTRD